MDKPDDTKARETLTKAADLIECRGLAREHYEEGRAVGDERAIGPELSPPCGCYRGTCGSCRARGVPVGRRHELCADCVIKHNRERSERLAAIASQSPAEPPEQEEENALP